MAYLVKIVVQDFPNTPGHATLFRELESLPRDGDEITLAGTPPTTVRITIPPVVAQPGDKDPDDPPFDHMMSAVFIR